MPCKGNDSSQKAVVVAAPLRKALVVDDNPVVRFINAKILKDAKYLVETASDGLEAVNKFKEGNLYDLVVIDWDMPNKTGPEAVREILEFLEIGENRDFKITIIGSSERSSDDDVRDFRNAGANHVWTKPFEAKMLSSLNK